ncbi:MAG: LacI family DNA-binding transcriptional regulator [Anaerolineales bacterium]|jgi:DNA-binding LacI/PurR family transcriptional regulator
MAITLQDISAKARVSMKTVSRVVNNEKNVSAETRQRVLKVIEEHGYVPHVQAQRLASGRTRSVSLHYPLTTPGLISNQIEMNFITGIATGAGEEDYYFGLITGQLTPTSLLKLCRGAYADGLIMMQIALQDWRVDLLRENNFPFVMIGRCEDNEGLSFIDLDFENAVMEVFAHLVSLGHQHIGFLTYPEKWFQEGLGPAIRTRQGFQTAVDKFNLTPIYRENELAPESVYAATKDLLREKPQLTALVVAHNTIAAGAIRALQDMDRKVPDDCSIVGIAFGSEAELTTPPLTAIDWPGHEVGQQAAKILIRQLNSEAPVPEQILVPPKLQVRRSTSRTKQTDG